MKPSLPGDDTRADRVLDSMALVFVLLAVFFCFTGTLDSLDGTVSTKAGGVARSESPALFWKLVRTSFGFGVAMIVLSALCALGARAFRPKS